VCQAGKIYGFEDCRLVLADDDLDAVIAILDNDLPAIALTAHISKHIAVAKIGSGQMAVTIVSAYFKYSLHTACFTERLRAILDREAKVVIGANTNAHSRRWFSSNCNERGVIVEDTIDGYNLIVENLDGNINTYERPNMGTCNIDVTLSTASMIDSITGWKVTNVTDSDHRLISFDLRQPIHTYTRPTQVLSYDTKHADWHSFRVALLSNIEHDSSKNIEE